MYLSLPFKILFLKGIRSHPYPQEITDCLTCSQMSPSGWHVMGLRICRPIGPRITYLTLIFLGSIKYAINLIMNHKNLSVIPKLFGFIVIQNKYRYILTLKG